MRNAYAAGTAAAIAAGVVGYFVVLRSLSFAAHSLTQIGFAGATGALAASVNPIYGLLVINGIGAGVIGFLGRRQRGRDVVVGVVLSAGLGLGLLFLALYRAQAAVPVLVGDVLGISPTEVRITEIAAGVIVVAVALVPRPARALGLAVGLSLLYIWAGLAVSYWVDFPPSVFVTAMAFAGYVAARVFRGGLTPAA